MNRFRVAYLIAWTWWLWLPALLCVWLYIKWGFEAVMPVLAVGGLFIAAAICVAIVIGWSELIGWLDNRAREEGRSASRSAKD